MLQLTHQTNDVAAKDVQQQVVREVASARMQQEALQRELNDAARFLDDVEAQLNTTRCECVVQAELLAVTQARLQSLATENARLKERLKAATAAGASVRASKSNANAARAELASIAGRLQEAQAVNEQLITSRT